jgi:NAD(P)-dependent dehydrogenase (short-subunit alcohol dehydrogenase family)
VSRTALVTGGGGRGIGRAISRRLLAEGWSLVTFDRVKPDDLDPRERFIPVDLADADATAAALEQARGGAEITGLVNNVGIVQPASLEDTTFESLGAVVNVNLRCAIQCAQALLPAMERARHGRIVNISSRAALGKELRTAYAATKAGLHGITRTWALELAPRGITVAGRSPHGAHRRRHSGAAHGHAGRHRPGGGVFHGRAQQLHHRPGAVRLRRHHRGAVRHRVGLLAQCGLTALGAMPTIGGPHSD